MRLAFVLVAIAACGSKHAPPDANKPVAARDPAVVARDAAAPAVDAAVAATRVEHAVWNAVDNRHTAHRFVHGELAIDGADVGLARYTRFGVPVARWHLGHIVAGERAAIADRLASLEVPLGGEAAAAATLLTARIHAEAKQAVALKINGRSAGRLAKAALEPGWQTVALSFDRGRLAAGENQLVFETSGGGKSPIAISWLRIGALPVAADDDPRSAASFDPKADAIDLASDAGLAWYVTVPDGANLVGSVDEGSCRIEVAARASDESFAGGLLGGGTNRIDLSALAGKVVRLAITAHECPRAHVAHLAITVHAPAPVAAVAADPPRFVILWIVDGLRADRLAAVAPPAWAELERASTAFRQFYVEGNEARLSTALAAAGYVTIGVTGGVDGALAQLDKHRDKPAYLALATARPPLACSPGGDVAKLRASYDASIVAIDRELGQLVAQLKSWAIWDQTMLIVTSNHGVHLLEDDRCGYDDPALPEAIVHVPLIIHDPARFPAGGAVDEGVEGIDLLPTMLAAIGKPPLAGAQGEALELLAEGVGRGWVRPSYASLAGGHTMRIGRWKIVVDKNGVASIADVVAHPDDAADAATTNPIELRMMTDALGLFLAQRSQWMKPAWGVVTTMTATGAAALDTASTP